MSDRIILSSNDRWVPIADIRVDPEGQRALRSAWVNKHVPEFDAELLGKPALNKRTDGHYYVIDGQHRVALLRAVGWGDQKVQCEVYEGLTTREEAIVFLGRNERVAVRAFDKFRQRIRAADPVARDVDRIARAHGLLISDGAADGHIRAPASLEWVYLGARLTSGKEAPGALVRTLDVITKAWGRSAAALDGNLIKGIGLVCIRYGDAISAEALAAKLGPVAGGAPGVLGRGISLKAIRGRALPDCIASVVVDIFNKGRRAGKVDDWWA